MARAYLGLGSNLGNRAGHLAYAIRELARCGTVLSRSPILETEPVDCPEGGPFLNACICLETAFDPRGLLDAAMRIERGRGRGRPHRNAPRSLDVDLLVFGQEILRDPDLTLPHPRMHSRRFVLDPLASVAPALVHPVLGVSVSELRARLARAER